MIVAVTSIVTVTNMTSCDCYYFWEEIPDFWLRKAFDRLEVQREVQQSCKTGSTAPRELQFLNIMATCDCSCNLHCPSLRVCKRRDLEQS